MDSNQLSGFDPRVQQQLANLSQNQRGRRGSFSSQSTASQSSYYSTYSTPYHSRGPRNSRGSGHFQAQPPPNMDSFPPLGSRSNRPDSTTQQPFGRSQDQYTLGNGQGQRSQSAAQEFFAHSRGRGRGRGPRRSEQFHASTDPNAYSRPSPAQQQLYNPGAHQHYVNSEQREANRRKHLMQSDYLNAVVNRSSANMLHSQEIEQKHAFAMRIEALARDVVNQHHNGSETPLPRVKLQAYGSLANSFGTTGCDMDLMLTVGFKENPFTEISEEVKRGLEKALLDQGIGARLLTNTRVPILKVCETPDPELLRNLRDHRSRWEMAVEEAAAVSNTKPSSVPLPQLTGAQEEEQARAALGLDGAAAEVSLPDSPPPNHAKLEYNEDCGIQCDINFGNHVALYNSKMLWTYGQIDPRVRHVGIFVKNWAKARDINTPYRGSLSSYGYILMVLHYLINVVRPPLLPNLQQMAKNDGWDQTHVELVNGHDVCYVKDMNVIRAQMASMTPNRSTPGALLLGFFRYYGNNHAGFRWTEQVISIRTPGGILSKQDKNWVKAKWSESQTNVRQRYLLAIEDPFEIDHNVGRTVGHNGVVAIREEFRRAWDMIEKVRSVQMPQGPTWVMLQPDGSFDATATDLLSTADSRGDLLRQDADHRKVRAEKTRQMRQELELSEQTANKLSLDNDASSVAGENENGMWQENGLRREDDSIEMQETTLLIQNFQHQDQKVSRMRSRKPERERVYDMDDDNDEPDEYEDDEPIDDDQPTNELGSYQDTTKDTYQMANEDTWEDERPVFETNDNNSLEDEQNATQEHIDSSMAWAADENMNEEPDQVASTLEEALPDEWKNVPQQDVPNASDSWDPDVVGQHIEWTQESEGGRWLLKRDELIRNGNFIPPTGSDYARIHTAFPYDPKMKRQRLAELNAKLEALYKHTLYPAFTADHNQEAEKVSKVIIDTGESQDNMYPSEYGAFFDSPAPVCTDDWPVGEDIPWTAENEIGRWLLWRDRKLKAGIEVKISGWAGIAEKLSQLYPYDPREKMANIDRSNAEIEKYFRDTTFPRRYMHKTDQYHHTQEILDGIERVIASRAPVLPSTAKQFGQIYQHEAPEDSLDHSTPRFNPVREPSRVENTNVVTQWTSSNRAGTWLQTRDARVVAGSWQDQWLNETSVFGYLNKLFPYQAEVNPQLRERQNEELDAFNGVWIPQRPEDNGEPAIKAILKIVEGRHDDLEAERIRLLIGLFRGSKPHDDFSKDVSKLDVRDRQAESKVVQAFSERLKENRALMTGLPKQPTQQPTPDVDDLAEIRRQRLAYYQRQEANSRSGDQAKPVSPRIQRLQRRDSAAEGSWNNASSHTDQRSRSQIEPVQDSAQTFNTAQQSPAEQGLEDTAPASQNLYERHDQFSQPNIIPIVTSSDFELDPAQIKDIKNIRAGGNGCARGPYSSFLLESDKFSWGAGGAMAHKSDTTKDEWSGWKCEEPHDDEATKRLDKELPQVVDW